MVAVRSDTALDVDWNTTDSDRYTIRRDDAFVAQVEDRTRYEDDGLSPGTNYSYEVVAIIDGRETQRASCSGTTADRALSCSVSVAGETVTASFNGGDFSRVTIRRDRSWLVTLSDGQTSHADAVPPGTYAYTATGVVNGFRSTADCGIADVAARTVICSVAVAGEAATVSFNGGDFSRSTIRRDGDWQATLINGETTFTQILAPGDHAFTVTGVFNGFRDTVDCGVATIAPRVLVCTATVQGDDVLLRWNDIGASSYRARRNGSWAATLDAGAVTWTDAGAAAAAPDHQIRYRLNGVQTTVDCA